MLGVKQKNKFLGISMIKYHLSILIEMKSLEFELFAGGCSVCA